MAVAVASMDPPCRDGCSSEPGSEIAQRSHSTCARTLALTIVIACVAGPVVVHARAPHPACALHRLRTLWERRVPLGPTPPRSRGRASLVGSLISGPLIRSCSAQTPAPTRPCPRPTAGSSGSARHCGDAIDAPSVIPSEVMPLGSTAASSLASSSASLAGGSPLSARATRAALDSSGCPFKQADGPEGSSPFGDRSGRNGSSFHKESREPPKRSAGLALAAAACVVSCVAAFRIALRMRRGRRRALLALLAAALAVPELRRKLLGVARALYEALFASRLEAAGRRPTTREPSAEPEPRVLARADEQEEASSADEGGRPRARTDSIDGYVAAYHRSNCGKPAAAP